MFTNKSSLVGISPPSSDIGVSPAPLLTVTAAKLSWAMDGHPWLYGQVLTTPGESHSQTPQLSHGNIFVCSRLSVITWQHACWVYTRILLQCILYVVTWALWAELASYPGSFLQGRSLGTRLGRATTIHNSQKKSLLTGHWIMSGNVLWFDEKWVHAKIFRPVLIW